MSCTSENLPGALFGGIPAFAEIPALEEILVFEEILAFATVSLRDVGARASGR